MIHREIVFQKDPQVLECHENCQKLYCIFVQHYCVPSNINLHGQGKYRNTENYNVWFGVRSYHHLPVRFEDLDDTVGVASKSIRCLKTTSVLIGHQGTFRIWRSRQRVEHSERLDHSPFFQVYQQRLTCIDFCTLHRVGVVCHSLHPIDPFFWHKSPLISHDSFGLCHCSIEFKPEYCATGKDICSVLHLE